MVQHLLVPVDGSDASWRAFDTAIALARRSDAAVEVVEVVFDEFEVDECRRLLDHRVEQHDTDGVVVTTLPLVTSGSVAAAIAGRLDARPESTIVMSSHGRGRTAALLGSVTEELLRLTFGPLVVVGPHATDASVAESSFEGPIVVAVDGSRASESVLALAAAWGIELAVTPWIVEVTEPGATTTGDVAESAYPARLARGLAASSGHDVEFEVLHGRDVHTEVANFAASLHASLIVASTHGRTGLARFMIGSTAAAIVRHARCPVLLLRPPNLPTR